MDEIDLCIDRFSLVFFLKAKRDRMLFPTKHRGDTDKLLSVQREWNALFFLRQTTTFMYLSSSPPASMILRIRCFMRGRQGLRR